MQFVTMTCEHLGQRSELREAIVKMMGHEGEPADLIGLMIRYIVGVLDGQRPSSRWQKWAAEGVGCGGLDEDSAMPI